MEGQERQLSSTEQRSIATWAFKVSLMIDLSDDPVVPLGYYREFALGREPPLASIVWLGAYRDSKVALAYRRQLQAGARGEGPKALVTTFTVFRVVFQVFHHFTAGAAHWNDQRPFAAGLHAIWPSAESVISWPRNQLAFGDDALEELAGSIDDPVGPSPP
jgi:hypothetical protein